MSFSVLQTAVLQAKSGTAVAYCEFYFAVNLFSQTFDSPI
jgi:hypothetical protein